MRFNNRNARGLYYYLFWIYLAASVFCSLMVMVLLVIYYLTGFSESVNLFNLFLLLILMLGAIYFRISAMHFHRILIENENHGRRLDPSMKLFANSHLIHEAKRRYHHFVNSHKSHKGIDTK